MKKQPLFLQNFEWYLPEDGNFWKTVAAEAERLEKLGVTAVWLPPAYKAASGMQDVGYGVYDMYDLGEFDQKGTIPTKYGTKDEYLKAINTLHKHKIQVFADVVFNHRMGADGTEEVMACRTCNENRNQVIEGERPIEAWTVFNFPGRGGKYSDFKWNHTHFDGVDWDNRNQSGGVYLFAGKQWEMSVDGENGNYDYLMGADVDMDNPEVIAELQHWGEWYLEATQVDGFRLDAVKHIDFSFYNHWLSGLREKSGKELPAIAEYWHKDVNVLCNYLDASGQVASLFDVPLHFKFHDASKCGGNMELSSIFQNTLVDRRPEMAITFVDNHDTQPEQALQSWVEGWFKPLAYAIILLREEGVPCVFYGDLYGIPHNGIAPVPNLEKLMILRQLAAWGRQTDYLDHPNIIGWTRQGDDEHAASGVAVLLTDGPGGNKHMCMGALHGGQTMVNVMSSEPQTLVLDEAGCGDFWVDGGSVSVWVFEAVADIVKQGIPV